MPRPTAIAVALLTAAALAASCRSGDESKDKTPAARSATPDDRQMAITSSLSAVWGSGPSDVWAVGTDGAMVHFDGHSWTASKSGTAKSLSAVYGTAKDDVWAVGDDGITLHFDGTSWTQTEQTDGMTLLGVWASSKTDVWISGIYENVGLLRHYNGKVWENAPAISASTSLWEVWGSGPKDVWMVGSNTKGGGFVLRGDGAHFDGFPFEGGSLRGIWGSGPDDVWASAYDGVLHHWDGKAWTAAPAVPLAQPGRFLGVWGAGSSDIWAVGFDGTILHYDGTAWSRSPTASTQILWSIWGSASDDVWIVGNSGTTLRWKGQGWKG
jgi:hypothetical protein